MTRLEDLKGMADRCAAPFMAIKPDTVKAMAAHIENMLSALSGAESDTPLQYARRARLVIGDFEKWNNPE